MYEQHYGFTARPFQLTPDPGFWFESTTHRKAMSYLGYGLAQGEGFIVITGEIGAGKTTLVGHLMATIDGRRLTAVQIVSTQVGGDDMLRLAAQGFGIATEAMEKAQILARIEQFLHLQARAGKRALLIVDEAQNLSPSALEELRMLSNFQLGGQSLVQIFLLGQPEFRERITGGAGMEQLRQRIIATHHLDPMLPEEVAPYIEHRLRVVGWQGNPRFTPDAYAMLASESGGVPRRLNALVSRVLLLGAIDRLDIIDRRVVEAVVADNGAESAIGGGAQGPEELSAPVPGSSEPIFPSAEVQPPASRENDTRHADLSELHSIRREIDALSAALSSVRAQPGPDAALTVRLDAFERRLSAVEQRADEQEEVLRRVLAKLIEWAERDERNGPFSHRAA